MPRPKRILEYDDYLVDIIDRRTVRNFLSTYNITTVNLPKVYYSPTCGVSVAGQTWIHKNGESEIELSSWILISKSETKRVIRHEIAHVLKHLCSLSGSVHGQNFNTVLKAVSPRTWRKDKHWYTSPVIDKERKKHHSRIKSGVDNLSH